MIEQQTFPKSYKPSPLEESMAQVTGTMHDPHKRQPKGREFKEQPENDSSS